MMEDKMITRSFEIRDTNEEKREVSGLAVPFNDTINIGGGMKEQFVRGAIDLNADVKLFRDHKEVIGKVLDMVETDEGVLVRAKISDTNLGNETLNLVKDGAIRSFSVGFIPVTDEKQDNTIIRKKVDLKEISLVVWPAYTNAAVTEVREELTDAVENNQEEISMENTNDAVAPEVTEIRSVVDELERKFDVLLSSKNDTPAVPQYRSFGEYVKAVVSGDEQALALHRTFAGGTTSDSVSTNAFVDETIRLVDKGRPTLAAFQASALPATGMNVEFVVVESDTTAVANQAAQGDALSFGKLELTTATAPVKTYGGYSSLSRQAIERSSVAYVDATFRALAIKYAQVTNAVARQTLITNAASLGSGDVLENTFDGWVEAIATASADINEETGLTPEFILVSTDAFVEIAKVKQGDAPLLAGFNQTNNIGTVSPVGLTGSFYGIPVIVDPSLAVGSVYIANNQGMVNYESAGAPFRLTDDEITNLTTDFSVWGYMASTLPQPKAIVKLDLSEIAS